MENALWFIGGFVVARLFSYLNSVVQSYLLIKQAEFDCLRMLGSAAESMAFFAEIRKKLIADNDLPSEIKNQIKIQANIDGHLVKTWKRAAIDNLVSCYPARYRRSLQFHDWESAMLRLTELYKNPKKN